MPRSYRLAIFAALGCLSLSASPHGHHHGKQGYQPQAHTHEREAAPTVVKPTPDPNNDDAAAKRCVGTEKPKLSCEAASAQASIDQARDADKQVGISVWQTIFVGGALAAAIYAGHWAKKAAKHTGTGSAAATQSLEHARDSAKRQLRPYVYMVSCTKDHRTGRVGGSNMLHVKNFGQTPAKNVTIQVKPTIGGYWSQDFKFDVSGQPIIHLGDIPPGMEKTQSGFDITISDEDFRFIFDAVSSAFLEGVIRYGDGGNVTTYETQFRLASTGMDHVHDVWVVTPKGNVST